MKKEYFKNNLLKKKDNNKENSDKKDKSKNIIKFINNYALNRNNLGQKKWDYNRGAYISNNMIIK